MNSANLTDDESDQMNSLSDEDIEEWSAGSLDGEDDTEANETSRTIKDPVLKVKKIVAKLNRHKNLLAATHQELIDLVEANLEDLLLDEQFSIDQLAHSRRSWTTLKKEVPTRWNSLYFSLKSVGQSISATNTAPFKLNCPNLAITPREDQVIQALLAHLEKIDKFSRKIVCRRSPERVIFI